MSKRNTDAERQEKQFWRTPAKAVIPLIIEIGMGGQFFGAKTFAEPCAGAGDLIKGLEGFGWECVFACDTTPQDESIPFGDCFDTLPTGYEQADYIITNPPWQSEIMHRMIETFSTLKPTWLLMPGDWCHTDQALRYSRINRKIVSVGRVSWMGNGKTGYDNAAWYLFDRARPGPCEFIHRRVNESRQPAGDVTKAKRMLA